MNEIVECSLQFNSVFIPSSLKPDCVRQWILVIFVFFVCRKNTINIQSGSHEVIENRDTVSVFAIVMKLLSLYDMHLYCAFYGKVNSIVRSACFLPSVQFKFLLYTVEWRLVRRRIYARSLFSIFYISKPFHLYDTWMQIII